MASRTRYSTCFQAGRSELYNDIYMYCIQYTQVWLVGPDILFVFSQAIDQGQGN